jgi:mono/diheme cytochrome c family protein
MAPLCAIKWALRAGTLANYLWIALSVICSLGLVQPAAAADRERGAYLTSMSCAGCHIAGAGGRDLADALPFEVIARCGNFNIDFLAIMILSPHPRMNFTVSPTDAADIAAYMKSLEQ